MIKQRTLDFLFKMQSKFGVRYPRPTIKLASIVSMSIKDNFRPHFEYEFKPKDLRRWYPKTLPITKEGTAMLSAYYDPKTGPDNVSRAYRSERIATKEHWSWVGRYLEVDFISHSGKYGWNAIWLYGVNDEGVNHEIDLIEHYGVSKGSKCLGDTNLHWGNYTDNHNQARAIPISGTEGDTVEGTIALDWTDPDVIKILFNGTVVRKIVDKKIIATFKTSNMRLIFNASVMKPDGKEHLSTIHIKGVRHGYGKQV